jgi:hypothetical protein
LTAIEIALPPSSSFVASCKMSESTAAQETSIKIQASMCHHLFAVSLIKYCAVESGTSNRLFPASRPVQIFKAGFAEGTMGVL